MEKITKYILILIIILVGITTLYLGISSNQSSMNQKPTTPEEIQTTNKPSVLFEQYYEEAKEILNTMSIEEKVSQMLLIPYTMRNKNEFSNVGGFIFYGNNVSYSKKEEIISTINNLQNNTKIKYAIVIDEEGGTVSRLGTNKNLRNKIFPSPRNLYNQGGLDLILKTEDEKDKLILELGFNLNLAPVADVSNNKNSFIYDRAIGLDANGTAEYISAVTKRTKENGLSTCLKHFPGYGENNSDTHYDSLLDTRSLEEFKNNDFIPFQAGIEAESPFVLMSHNTIQKIDSKYPASISKKVIDILKNDLGFTGIVLTDDIAMNALAEFNSQNQAAILAIEAGNDMIMTKRPSIHYQEIINAINNNIITEERINESVTKILAWKLSYNIIKKG